MGAQDEVYLDGLRQEPSKEIAKARQALVHVGRFEAETLISAQRVEEITDPAELARRFQDPKALEAMRYVQESLAEDLRTRAIRSLPKKT